MTYIRNLIALIRKKKNSYLSQTAVLKRSFTKNLLLMENNVSIYKELSCLETEEKRTTIHPGRLLLIRFIDKK